ncbi:protein kinase domain-containing protein [Gemmatimonas phototrophica]|uniref:protein kinase domain-containing protein n=1 Tax=Gemmatimonas phototrophica TaxID=1379270 RepID=UPI0006A6AD55|nr:protein kinase [Gemmatimonas phototrophica]
MQRLSAALSDRYRVVRQLGEGGMATVYLCEDIKHDRQVALKLLKPELAAVLGAERFVQEIKTTAALQHPHILPLFDSGAADGFLFYVMPFIDGETLRAKLDRETQLGVEDAVRIARDVADALHYAHTRGIVHRDVKPENILLHDGRPMVADFGIALAVSAAAGGRMTETGLSLGTPHYMSPEQATAEKEISARSDVYSIGSVLYEMLTGNPPFTGASAQQIIMKIITTPAEAVTVYRKSVPPNVAAAVAKSLEKLPADRFETAKAFAEALGNPAFTDVFSNAQSRGVRGGASSRSAVARWGVLGWAVGAAGLALAAWSWRGTSGPDDEQASATYLNVALADSTSLANIGPLGSGVEAIALSADGRLLVYAASSASGVQLYRRDLNRFTTEPIKGTEGAYAPMLSPDNRWVAFFVGNELRKVPIDGGTAVLLATVPEMEGASWSRDGRILVAAREGDVLGWVPESGGTIAPIPNPSRANRQSPQLLADGQHALVWAAGLAVPPGVYAVNLVSGALVAITMSGPKAADSLGSDLPLRGTQPGLLPSGYLTFVTSAGMMAVAFDPSTLGVRGRPVEVLSGVAHYAVANTGMLVYAPSDGADRSALVWVTPDGAVDSLGFSTQRYGTFSLSPDGRRLAVIVESTSLANELWVYDLQQRARVKVRTQGFVRSPSWWPDSRRIVFNEYALAPGTPIIAVRQLVESAGERDTLGVGWEVSGIAPDTTIAVGTKGFGRGAWIFPLTKGQPPVSLDSFPTAWGPTVSPDGRWIAYTSNEAGQYDIYVAPTARRGERRKVSLGFGEEPVWSPRGDKLFYRAGTEWYGVSVPTGAQTEFGRAAPVFRGPYANVLDRSHDISRDGRRHLVLLGPPRRPTTHLNVIQNWVVDVRAKVAAQDTVRR